MRRVKRDFCRPGWNSMRDWHRRVHPLRVAFNFAVITVARYTPSLKVKNFLYRRFLGVRVGKNVSVGLMAMLDIFYPQMISIGDNSVIGYNTTILTHEFLVEEFRIGSVEIGREVMVGANCTLLPGIKIGDGARVGAGSLVNRDIPPGVLACGVPARVVESGG